MILEAHGVDKTRIAAAGCWMSCPLRQPAVARLAAA
jgi:hypothetical protein